MEHEINTETQPLDNAEKAELERYDVIADQIIDKAEKAEPLERLTIMQDFIAELRSEASGGHIKNRKGEPYTLNALDEQFAIFSEEINLPEDKREIKDPLNLIPRSENLRSAFAKLISHEATATPLLDAIAEYNRTNEKEKSVEQLTPETTQAIGAAGLLAAEVKIVDTPAAGNEYDSLFNAHNDGPVNVEDAAVRPKESDEDRLNRERRNADYHDAQDKAYKRPEMR